jgi:hypothetical protein
VAEKGRIRMRVLLRVTIAIAVATSLLAACSGGAAAFPTGKWTATNEAGSVGVMDFRADGTWTLTGDGTVVSSGTYATDQTTLTFKTDEYCKTVDAEQGTYTWTHANDQLTLDKQADACTDRVRDLDGRIWKPAA